jgi:cell pole-organizing protein PopZ
MSSSPDKTDARSMSDILASIRKIMAQDTAAGGPAIVKPPVNSADGAPRAGVRLPTPEAPREPASEQAHRAEAKPAAPAPTPATQSSAAAPAAPTKPAPLATDEPVSLDEFLALAAPPKDVVTTPIVAKSPAGAAMPAAPAAPAAAKSAPAPSTGSAPDWLFPRARSPEESKGEAIKEPAFGTAPKAASASPSTPMATPVQAPVQAKDTGAPRAAPPAPKGLGDLGSVVPGRFDGRGEGAMRGIGESPGDANDRFSPVGGPTPGATSVAPSRPVANRTAPAPNSPPPFEAEIPGADALRRLIAGVVPPSALTPSAPARAPAPNADDVRTEIVPAVQGRTPAGGTDATPVSPATPTFKVGEAPPAAESIQPTPTAKPAEAAPVAKSPEAVPATKPSEAAPAPKTAPVESTPAAAAKSPAQAPVPDAAPRSSVVAGAPTSAAATAATALAAGRTMDETVVELLRPLLRDWLDANMPRLIEPALKAELEALRSAIAKDKKD